MNKKLVIFISIIIFFSCGKEAVDCITLENDLIQHPHISDLEIYLSTFEAADDFIGNCHSYYDEMELMLDNGCIDGWNTDSLSHYRNSTCGGPLIGVWMISSLKTYLSQSCSGPYINTVDTIAWKYGSRLSLNFEFTLDEIIQKVIGKYSGSELCNMGLGIMSGDTCNTFTGGIAVDSLCAMNDGIYSTESDSCNYDILLGTMNYSIDSQGINLISYMGTDSVEIYRGNWSINNGNSLEIIVSDSYSCIEIIGSR